MSDEKQPAGEHDDAPEKKQQEKRQTAEHQAEDRSEEKANPDG